MRPLRDERGLVAVERVSAQAEKIATRIAAGDADWGDHEALGRLQRALGQEAEAEQHLRASLDRPPPRDRHYRWLARAAVYRLLGEDDEVERCARQAIATIGDDASPVEIGSLVEASFLIGDDGAAVETVGMMPSGYEGRSSAVAALAAARSADDASAASDVVGEFVSWIRRDHDSTVEATAGFGLYDWYEVAQEVTAQLRA